MTWAINFVLPQNKHTWKKYVERWSTLQPLLCSARCPPSFTLSAAAIHQTSRVSLLGPRVSCSPSPTHQISPAVAGLSSSVVFLFSTPSCSPRHFRALPLASTPTPWGIPKSTASRSQVYLIPQSCCWEGDGEEVDTHTHYQKPAFSQWNNLMNFIL